MAEVADKYLSKEEPLEAAARQIASELRAMYGCLSSEAPFAADRLATHCRRFAALWVTLKGRSADPLWRVKPKLHLLQELCEMSAGARPALFWTYRDEEFGGTCAQWARRRGGTHSAKAVGRSVLLRFITREAVPRLR